MLLSFIFHRNCHTVQSCPERKDIGIGDRFMKIHGSGKCLLFTFKIEVSVIFAYNVMIKLSVKGTGLLAWRHALVLKILIWIFDFGPKKLAWETGHRGDRVMFHIFFRSLCSWWDFLPKNNRTPQLYFVYLLRLTCLKKKTDKQLQTLTLQPNSLLHSHSGWSHARWRGICMTPGYKGEWQPTRFNSMKFVLSKKYQSG